MKKLFLLQLFVFFAGTFTAEAGHFKRGLSEGSFKYRQEMDDLSIGGSWFYNWGITPNNGIDYEVINNSSWEFVPQCWNANYDVNGIREYVLSHPNCKYIFGYNEPNFPDQANMKPQQAANDWPRLQALAKELKLTLVSPAVNNSPDPEWSDPVKWMTAFTDLVGEEAYDHIAMHAYGGIYNIMDTATRLWEKFHKPIWVTEFCYWPFGGASTVSQNEQCRQMVELFCWLEKTEYIYRYAWFKAVEDRWSSEDGWMIYRLLDPYVVKVNGRPVVHRKLNRLGLVFNHLGTFDSSVYRQIDEWVSVADMVDCQGVNMDVAAEECAGKPIEISEFNGNSSIDFNFEVPTTGTYTLTLKVCGMGEPERFDPSIAVYEVGNNGALNRIVEAQDFSLPNSNETYIHHDITFNLTAGHHTLRLKNGRPNNPSGLHINGVKLVAGTTGIGDIARIPTPQVVDVFTTAGMCIRQKVNVESATEGLPAGSYIVGGRKMIVK